MNTTSTPNGAVTLEAIQAELQALKNLDAFATKSGIPRRTLMRVKNAEPDSNPRQTTLTLIDLALKKHRPAKKE
jgi:hypothetical protein